MKNLYKLFDLSKYFLVLAVGMNIIRLFMIDAQSYVWLNWNLFLALIPILFYYLFFNLKKNWARITSFFAWLLFLPNALYLVTDFLHLRNVGPEWVLWYDGMMIFAYSLLGILSFAFTTHFISKKVFKLAYLHSVGFISFLSAFGIYLGRYIRWNTWDIVTRPFSLFENIFNIIFTKSGDSVFLMTLVSFTALGIISVKFISVIFNEKDA